MKFSSIIKITLVLIGVAVLATACFKDLDTTPLDEDVLISDVVYDDPGAYKQVLAKLYASLAVTGQEGPAGQPDISGIDEGFGSYLRMYWYAQELTTEEAIIGWNDATIKDFHDQDWNSQDGFIFAMYSRIYYTISLCNEFLRESTDGKLEGRGQSNLKEEVGAYRAEARFLRALAYYHALDLFRSVPFVTEEDVVGSFFPEQSTPEALFTFLEDELKAIENELAAPTANEYGRADRAAAWMLLAKLYLNAEVYIGQNRYSDAASYSKQVIDAGYTLEPVYEHNFLADNHTSTEIIFPITFDGTRTQTYGGTTFIINASIGGDMEPGNYGMEGGWGGTRVTSALVNKFPAVGAGGAIVVAPNEGNTASYDRIYVPGSYQDWNPGNEVTVMTSPNSDLNYEGYFWFPDADTKFKFTEGPNWDVNFGDDGGDGTLDPNGADITVADPGFYKINANFNDLTYSIVKTEWGLIGDATGSWDVDQNMTYNPESGAWEITADLVVGEIKFRANDGWDINYGDDGADAILEAGAGNIAIANAGKYLIKLFLDKPDYTYSIELASFDARAMFYTEGQTLEITDISDFTNGYAATKFKNVTRDGMPGSNGNFADTDFPVFRLSDAYLMYAEALLRSGGSTSEALGYVNQVRTRAEADPIEEGDLTLEFLLDERAREFYWECHRRTDLVRFGQFTDGSYVWPWKGGVAEGTQVASFRDIFPIPAAEVGANPNLTQNPNY